MVLTWAPASKGLSLGVYPGVNTGMEGGGMFWQRLFCRGEHLRSIGVVNGRRYVCCRAGRRLVAVTSWGRGRRMTNRTPVYYSVEVLFLNGAQLEMLEVEEVSDDSAIGARSLGLEV